MESATEDMGMLPKELENEDSKGEERDEKRIAQEKWTRFSCVKKLKGRVLLRPW